MQKLYNNLKILKEILRFFENFIKVFAKIYGGILKVFEIWMCRGFLGLRPLKQAKIPKKLVQKSLENAKL